MSKKFLELYLNSLSPSGYENESQQIWVNYMKDYVDKFITDHYGTAVGIINPDSDFKVVIEAHVDEISFIVSYITDKGYIYVKKNGGADHQIAPSKRVNIHTKNGLIPGFFGWPAIHTRGTGTKETHASADNIFIDCGFTSKKDVESSGIYVGCLVTYPDELTKMNNKFYTGRALDNKMGGYILTQVVKRLREEGVKLPFGLYVVNAVQEEVGLRGSRMIVETIRPNAALILDVTHDTTTPMMEKMKNGDIRCGKGPVLTYGAPIQQKLLELVEGVATKQKIDFQRKVCSRSTGTDTDSFAYSVGGVPSCLISLPLKYMHTTVETVDIEDIKKTEDLIFEVLKKIEYQHEFKYIKI